MNSHPLEVRVVLLALKAFSRVLLVLGVFFLFLVVIYLDIPGTPLSLCSVHSRMTCTLLPFAFFAIMMKN